MWFGFLIIIVILAVFFFLVWKTSRSRKLPAVSVTRIQSMLQKTNQLSDPVMRILEYDKILDQLLYDLGFQGSTADKLKKGGPRFSNVQTLWQYHKLRNTIAHEHGATANTRDADGFRDSIIQALKKVS
jgi:hypothetical protein